MVLLKADGTDAGGGNGPWWVKSLWVVGPITMIAIGLVYLLAVDVRNDSRLAASTAVVTQRDLADHQKHTEQLHQNIEGYMRTQLLLMRQLCSNSAKSADERRGCFQP